MPLFKFVTFEHCTFTNCYNFNYRVQHLIKFFITVCFSKIIKGHSNYGNGSKMSRGSLTIRLLTAWNKDNRCSVRFTFRWFCQEHYWLVRRRGISLITLSSYVTALLWSSADGNDVRDFFVSRDGRRTSSETFVRWFFAL